MSKKQQPKKNIKPVPAVITQPLPPLKPLSMAENVIHFISEKKNQLLLIVLVTFVFYGNSIFNDYALDDIMFVTHNMFVQKGFNGIYDLFTKESMYGFIGNASPISGGRWRPLSLITFAIEKQFFGASPHISHFINLLLLALIGVIMILFLRKYIFKSSPVAAFMVVLLFIIHPVHTEAVTNIKSRDELLSWLFLLLTLYYSMNFFVKRIFLQLLLAFVCYFLALLSKENGVSFLAILPLTFYFFTKEKANSIVLVTIPFAVVLGIYIIMRVTFVPFAADTGKEIMNAPYLYATPIQHFATVMLMLGKYITLLFWPNPLSCDYSYNQVPYVNFSSPLVWLSMLVQAALVLYALMKLKEKSIIAYGILFYFCSIFVYSNLFIDIGTFLGERFLFQPSFGFCLAMVVFFNEAVQKIKFKNLTLRFSFISVLLVAILVLSGFQTIRRNADWKSDTTLWPNDVKAVPNSARAQNGCGMSDILITNNVKDSVKKMQLLHEAVSHLKRAHQIQPTYIDPWLNMGVAYSRIATQLDSAEYCWNQARKLDAHHPMLVEEYDPAMCIDFMNAGLIKGTNKNYSASIRYFYRALQHNKRNPDVWYNLGGVYFTIARYDSARIAWQQCLKLKPDYTKAKQGLSALPVPARALPLQVLPAVSNGMKQ
jgi:protein O-mannosyl-transferase